MGCRTMKTGRSGQERVGAAESREREPSLHGPMPSLPSQLLCSVVLAGDSCIHAISNTKNQDVLVFWKTKMIQAGPVTRSRAIK